MRGACIGPGRHRSNIARQQNKKTCGRSSRAIRSDPCDDGNRRRKDGFNNFAHGIDETAGRIQAQDDSLGSDFLCMIQPRSYVSSADGMNNVAEIDLNDHSRGGRRSLRRRQ